MLITYFQMGQLPKLHVLVHLYQLSLILTASLHAGLINVGLSPGMCLYQGMMTLHFLMMYNAESTRNR